MNDEVIRYKLRRIKRRMDRRHCDDEEFEAMHPRDEGGRFAEKEQTLSRSDKERDIAYRKAVESDDMKEAQRLVDEAAKKHGVFTTESGQPLKLYHGTYQFGFTEFNTDVIFTTPNKAVAVGYGGGKGYADPREVREQYTPDDGTIDTLIKNAKNVLHLNVREVSEDDIDRVKKQFTEQTDEIASAVDEGWSYGDGFPEMPNEIETGLSYMLMIPGEIRDSLDDLFEGYSPSGIQDDIEQYEKHKDEVRDWFGEHRKEILASGSEKLYKLVTGYDVSDYIIDAQYKLLKYMLHPEKHLITEGGSFVSIDDLRDSVEQNRYIGAYTLYGDPGDKPLEIDAKGAFWTDIEAPMLSDKKISTDTICSLAKEKGYTSVVIRNVMDPAMNNYSSNTASDDYIFFNSSDLSSADPVAIDEDGDVIPLSERFQSNNPDIRGHGNISNKKTTGTHKNKSK